MRYCSPPLEITERTNQAFMILIGVRCRYTKYVRSSACKLSSKLTVFVRFWRLKHTTNLFRDPMRHNPNSVFFCASPSDQIRFRCFGKSDDTLCFSHSRRKQTSQICRAQPPVRFWPPVKLKKLDSNGCRYTCEKRRNGSCGEEGIQSILR